MEARLVEEIGLGGGKTAGQRGRKPAGEEETELVGGDENRLVREVGAAF